MRAVFVSYRRGDADGQARALVAMLAQHLGKASIFIDVDSITPGRDFRVVLKERLESCDAMLALIGRQWLDARDASGQRRLDDPNDFVRQEISAALKRNISVTPVLLEGVKVPSPDSLPEDMRDLSFRNSFELSHSRWESDVNEMIRRLGLSTRKTPYWIGLAAAAVLVLAGAAWYFASGPTGVGASARRMGPLEEGIDRNAYDLYKKPSTVSSADACSDLCGREPRCEAFTFTPRFEDKTGNTGNCWLKFFAGTPAPVPGYVSGVKLGGRKTPEE
jgi:hypothetical protein